MSCSFLFSKGKCKSSTFNMILKESLNLSWKGELRVMGLVKLFQHTMTRYVDIRCMHVDVDWIHRMPHRNGLKP